MRQRCSSGKKQFQTREIAEDVLIELWARNNYSQQGAAPVDVYECEECRYFHLTSRQPMNAKLAQYLSSNKARLDREAARWADRLKPKNR